MVSGGTSSLLARGACPGARRGAAPDPGSPRSGVGLRGDDTGLRQRSAQGAVTEHLPGAPRAGGGPPVLTTPPRTQHARRKVV